MDKILKILHIFPSFAHGGQQRRFALLANALSGYEHHIVALDGDYSAQSLLENQVVWEKHPLELEKTSFISPANLKKYRGLYKRVNPDLVCSYNWGSIEAVLANKIGLLGRARHPHLHHEDGFGPDEKIDQQNKKRVWARHVFLNGINLLVPSKGLERAAKEQWRLRERHIHFVPNGVDLNRFQSSSQRRKPLIIGSVGALRAEKNFERLIRVCLPFLRNNEVELHIVGDGPEKDKLQAVAKALGVETQVRFCGASNEPEKFYQSFDVFCLTSDTEQMPFTVLEAMASELPVVATNVGDVAQMVAEEGREFVLPLGEDALFSEKLGELIRSSDLRKSLGVQNREQVMQNYDLGKMVERFDMLFRELVAD